MKKNQIAVAVWVILLLFAFSGCSLFHSPKHSVESYVENLLAEKEDVAAKYLLLYNNAPILPENSITSKIKAPLLKKTKILSVEEVEEGKTTAMVKLTIEGPKVDTLMDQEVEKVFATYFQDTTLSDEAMNEEIAMALKESISNKDCPLEERSVTLELTKDEDEWKLPYDAEVAVTQIIFGKIGLVEAMR